MSVINKLVRNERRKLTATFINGVAVAMLAIGGLTQVVAFAQSLTLSVVALIIALSCIGGSIGLHWLGRFLLEGLEE